jgi:hypothetical protein
MPVILSAAKHLLFLVESKQKQIPRFARDDMIGGSFSGLLDSRESVDSLLGRTDAAPLIQPPLRCPHTPRWRLPMLSGLTMNWERRKWLEWMRQRDREALQISVGPCGDGAI